MSVYPSELFSASSDVLIFLFFLSPQPSLSSFSFLFSILSLTSKECLEQLEEKERQKQEQEKLKLRAFPPFAVHFNLTVTVGNIKSSDVAVGIVRIWPF